MVVDRPVDDSAFPFFAWDEGLSVSVALPIFDAFIDRRTSCGRHQQIAPATIEITTAAALMRCGDILFPSTVGSDIRNNLPFRYSARRH